MNFGQIVQGMGWSVVTFNVYRMFLDLSSNDLNWLFSFALMIGGAVNVINGRNLEKTIAEKARFDCRATLAKLFKISPVD